MLRSLSWCWCSGKKYFFSSLREIPWYSSWVLAPTNDSILLQSEIIDHLHGTGKLTRISLFTIVLFISADTEAFPDPKLDLHHHGLWWATILCIFHFTWSRNNWSAWVCDLQKKRWRWLESWWSEDVEGRRVLEGLVSGDGNYGLDGSWQHKQ